MTRMSWVIATLLLGLGCGSTQHPAAEHTDNPDDIDVEEQSTESPDEDDGMAIEGLRGSFRRDEVDSVMNRAAARFADCYSEALDDHPYLVGDLALGFTVAPDGSVRDVRTTSATLGSREVEECILDQARRLHFPYPHGGEADFDYGPMVMNPGDDARPPDIWPASRVSEQVETHQSAVEACTQDHGGFQATLYVGPGGRVRSVGVVAPSAHQQEAARCLERELTGWELPDPGTWIAKISLEL